MSRRCKIREITPNVRIRHTDVNAIVRKRSRSFSHGTCVRCEGKGECRGRLPKRKREKLAATLSRSPETATLPFGFRSISITKEWVQAQEMEIKGGERKVPVPIGRTSQLCRLRIYLTARSAYAMATRLAANFTSQSLAR